MVCCGSMMNSRIFSRSCIAFRHSHKILNHTFIASKFLSSEANLQLGKAVKDSDQIILPRKIPTHKEEQHQLFKLPPNQPLNPRCLKVALIGAPNAGKSTLANKLIGWRFSSVSNKVHTTRSSTLGVLTEDDTQIIFLDTPGLTTEKKIKKHAMERSLLVDPHSVLLEADLIVVVVDVSTEWGRNRLDMEVLKALHAHQDKDAILVMNKTDLVKTRSKLLKMTRVLTNNIVAGEKVSHNVHEHEHSQERIDQLFDYVSSKNEKIADTNQMDDSTTQCSTLLSLNLDKQGKLQLNDKDSWKMYYKRLNSVNQWSYDSRGWSNFSSVFMISALNGDGIYNLKRNILSLAPPASWVYNSALITNQNPITLARQFVLEAVMDAVTHEVPYQVEIKVVMWEINDSGYLTTAFDILCPRNRHMSAIIGAGGKVMRSISQQAQQAMMDAFQTELSVKLAVRHKNASMEDS